MFERFGQDARKIVFEARRDAIERNSPEINSMHLLAALLRFPSDGAGRLLTRFGVSIDDVAAETDRVRRRGGITEADAAALGELGIDVDLIIDRIEQDHGPNALAGTRVMRGKRRHIQFAADSKMTLSACLREMTGIGGKQLGSELILLALAARRGPAADVLARFGVDAPRLRAALSAP